MKPSTVLIAKWHNIAAVLVMCLCATPHALAQTAEEKAIRARQAGYYLMSQQMTHINAALKGEIPFDKTALETSAEALEILNRIVFDNFPPGSGRGNTKAKPEVWTDNRRFKQLAEASHNEILKLKGAVRSGDMGAIKTAYGATAKACKACHDDFKDR